MSTCSAGRLGLRLDQRDSTIYLADIQISIMLLHKDRLTLACQDWFIISKLLISELRDYPGISRNMIMKHCPFNSSPLVLHIYVSVNWVSIGSDNGLLPARCQAIIWNNAGILLIGPLGTSFSEIQIEIENLFIHENAFLRLSSGKWWPFCPGGDELTLHVPVL